MAHFYQEQNIRITALTTIWYRQYYHISLPQELVYTEIDESNISHETIWPFWDTSS